MNTCNPKKRRNKYGKGTSRRLTSKKGHFSFTVGSLSGLQIKKVFKKAGAGNISYVKCALGHIVRFDAKQRVCRCCWLQTMDTEFKENLLFLIEEQGGVVKKFYDTN